MYNLLDHTLENYSKTTDIKLSDFFKKEYSIKDSLENFLKDFFIMIIGYDYDYLVQNFSIDIVINNLLLQYRRRIIKKMVKNMKYLNYPELYRDYENSAPKELENLSHLKLWPNFEGFSHEDMGRERFLRKYFDENYDRYIKTNFDISEDTLLSLSQ